MVKEAESIGYTSLWIAEVSGPDAFVSLAAVALNSSKADLALRIRAVLALWMGIALSKPGGAKVKAGKK